MRAQPFSHLRPTPATVIALLALVFATTGVAAAKPADKVDKDEVTLVTLTGGPVDTTVPNEEVPITLNGESTFSFTQKAGEAVQLIAEAALVETAGVGECGVDVIVYDSLNVDPEGRTWGTRSSAFRERGDFGEGTTDIDGLPAPASDRTVTLTAFARETDGCDETSLCETEGDCEEDTWSVSLRVTIVTIRN